MKINPLELHLAINYAGGEPIFYEEYTGNPVILKEPLEIMSYIKSNDGYNIWGEDLLPMHDVYIGEGQMTKKKRKDKEHAYRKYQWEIAKESHDHWHY